MVMLTNKNGDLMVVKMVINMVNGDYCWLMVINGIIMVIVVINAG
jgi:hypothetical protein